MTENQTPGERERGDSPSGEALAHRGNGGAPEGDSTNTLKDKGRGRMRGERKEGAPLCAKSEAVLPRETDETQESDFIIELTGGRKGAWGKGEAYTEVCGMQQRARRDAGVATSRGHRQRRTRTNNGRSKKKTPREALSDRRRKENWGGSRISSSSRRENRQGRARKGERKIRIMQEQHQLGGEYRAERERTRHLERSVGKPFLDSGRAQ